MKTKITLTFILLLCISQVHADYTFITKWGSQGSGDGQFDLPREIAIDNSGNVYVVDEGNSRIQKFNSNGTFITKWGSLGSGDGQFIIPAGITIDSSGNVYVVEFGNHRVQKFNSSGIFISKWGSNGSGDGQFNNPHGVTVDSSGNVYVADWGNHRIQKFNSSGTFITKWGSSGSGDGQFNYPEGVAVDSSGNVYVTDRHRIQKFNSSGTFITKWGSLGSGDGQFYYPFAIAIDNSGNVYVADYANHRIQKFNSSGMFITKWGSEGTGDGQFSYPSGVAVDNSGNVYVSDHHRIQKFSPRIRIPVVVIPGIMGSKLYNGNFNDDNLIWPNMIKILLPGSDFLDVLKLSSDGKNPESQGVTILVGGIVDKYDPLINYLHQNGYSEDDGTLIIFSYDWRKDIQDSAALLKNTLSSYSKINIVAHSMGGLVAMAALNDPAFLQKVNKLITLGTPYQGAPKAYKILQYGDSLFFGGTQYPIGLLSSEKVREISQNMPGIYQLLPTVFYDSTYSKTFDWDKLDNKALLERARSFQAEIGSNAKVPTYAVIGYGEFTRGSGDIIAKAVSGDGTVPFKSAQGIYGSKLIGKYYIEENHLGLVSNSRVLNFISEALIGDEPKSLPSTLAQEPTLGFFYSLYIIYTQPSVIKNLALRKSMSGSQTWGVPIKMYVYDSQGHRICLTSQSIFEVGIPNSEVENGSEGLVMWMLDDRGNYRMEFTSSGEGTLSLQVSAVHEQTVVGLQRYDGIQVISRSAAKLSFGEKEKNYVLLLDRDGDGIYETEIKPTYLFKRYLGSDLKVYNFPNPFNPNKETTTIRCSVPGQGLTEVTIDIFNLAGELVRTLRNTQEAGFSGYQTWDGKNEQGGIVASGIYIARVKANGQFATHKIAVLK